MHHEAGDLVTHLPSLTFAASMRSASLKHRRGGDLFEVVRCKDGTTSVLIADLSSKGAAADLHAASLRSAFKRFVGEQRQPARILSFLNRLTLTFDAASPWTGVLSVSALVATFDQNGRSMTYASAGHDHAMVIGDTAHRHLSSTGPLMGLFDAPLFAEHNEPLETNDLLVLVTDGVTECRDANGKGMVFGTQGIVQAVASARCGDPRIARDAIGRSLDDFGGRCYRDDATIAVCAAGYTGRAALRAIST
jgi:serine phosphatase RsbU (regulator of sigma subunit)